LLAAGFEDDLRFAARVDVTEAVPVLYDEDGVKTLRVKARGRVARQA
jgi:phosphosulfolactate phosphohydrolase-like enzyme